MKSISPHNKNRNSRRTPAPSNRDLLVEEFTGSRRLFLMLGVLLVLFGVLFSGSNIVTKLLRMPIESVDVQGELEFVSDAKIQEIMARHIYEGYLDVTLSELKNEIEALPWVFTARLQRTAEQKLVVNVVEQQPVAIWHDKGYLNKQGELFRPGDFKKPKDGKLVNILGPDDRLEETWARYLELKQRFSKYNLGLRKMVMDDKGGQKVVLNNGIHVMFGSQDIEERLKRFFAVYETYLTRKRKDIKRVDLRYTNGVSVSWLNQKNI
ncbi:MAG: cell division protein FtsQ/DivIB [Pseudomonadota bacterium]